jgi:hypothetical protein
VIHHIDLGMVLRGAVCDLYSNLVTRPTGAAVRTEIERALAETDGRLLTVIDFSQVTLLDFSCADEIVAKLMLRYCGETPPDDGFFVFRGLGDHHLDAIEAVLERHGLAIVALFHDEPTLVGAVEPAERDAWELARLHGPAETAVLAAAAGESEADVGDLLQRLARRRLVMRLPAGWAAVGASIIPRA